jgi:arsenite-transporting ATPase
VLLPEDLSIAESVDGLRALARARIAVPEVIVNRAIPPGVPCPICDVRRKHERRAIARIRQSIGKGRRVRVIAADVHEPRGMVALSRIGRQLVSPPSSAKKGYDPFLGRGLHKKGSYPFLRSPSPPESIAAFRGARLLFFGGKGGVGKTTSAAGAAVRLARADPSRRVLLLSTDPAHSLGDVFAAPVGDRAAAVRGGPGNLFVRELDAPAALAARKADLEAALADILSALGGEGTKAAEADRGVRELMDLAPPGIDELFGMLTVVEAQRHYPLIIVDTAPTGHALRLLEMPDAARDWVQVLLRVLLKYRSLVRPGQLASELVDLSKTIRTLHQLMRDPEATRFIVVTRATEVTRLETDRLLDALRRLRLATPAVVMNAMTLTPGGCPRCLAAAKAERRHLALAAKRCRRGCVIIQTPLAAPPPRGVRALDRWARAWILTRP